MIDERRESQASLYALGALPPEETPEFEHAMRTDLQLQLLVVELRDTADAMVAVLPRLAPSPSVKQAVLAAIERRSKAPAAVVVPDFGHWSLWVPWAIAASFAILCLILISQGTSLRHQMVNLQERMEETTRQASALQDERKELQDLVDRGATNYERRLADFQNQLQQKVQESRQEKGRSDEAIRQQQQEWQTERRRFADQAKRQDDVIKALQDELFIAAPATADNSTQMVVTVLLPTPDATTRAFGAAAFNPREQRGVLVVENLPPLPNDRQYQLWLIDAQVPAPSSAGVFQPDNQGRARYQFQNTAPLPNVGRVAISIERRGGAISPQGKIILASN